MPSIWPETYSIVIREAFACSIPVIASRIGALPEGIRDGENGLLFEPGSTVGLAAILRMLDGDRSRLDALRNGIRETDWITPRERTDQLRTLLSDVVAKRPTSSRPHRSSSSLPSSATLSPPAPQQRASAAVPSSHVDPPQKTMDGAAGHLPLSALRTTLEGGSARWLVDADGVPGRILVVAAGSTATFPLRLSQETLFSSRAMLFPHDWRDRLGALRMSVTVAAAAGERSTLWTSTLHAGGRDSPRGIEVRCRLPGDAAALQLAVEPEGSAAGTSLERAIWVSPALTDPNAPPLPEPTPLAAGEPPLRLARGTPLISVLVPRPRPALHARRGHRLRPRPDLPQLGAVPRRRRLHQPRDHRRPAAPRRLRPPHPPHPPRHRPRHLRRHQRRPGHSPPATTSRCWTTTTPSPPTPSSTSPTASPPTRPRHDLQRRGHRPGRPADLGPSQAGVVAGHAAHQRLHLPSRASTAARWSARSAGFAPSSTAPRTST